MSSTISPEQVAERLGLDAKRLEEECHESSFPSLRNLVHPWRLVFSNLLTPVDLDDVESEHSSRPEEEKRLGCLRKWKARLGAKATFKVIVEAVLLSGSLANAEAICQHLLQQPEVSQDHNVVVQTRGDEGTTQSLSRAGVEMVRSNVEEIRALFASLLLSVQAALKKNSNVDDVRQFLITFFDFDFSTTLDLKGLLSAVTRNGLWDYQHYSPLEKLANSLLSNDLEVEELIRAYKARLSGFYLTTKLIDFIECQQLPADDSDDESDQPTPALTSKQFKKIKVVLQLDRKISDLSLGYVQKLWRSLAVEYEIPSLTAVIDRIVSGSLMISWKVPSHLVEQIVPRSRFFRKHDIILVYIDDVIIYDESKMAAKEKKLLNLCYHGTADIDQFSSLLKQGVDPDIYDEDGHHPLWHASYDGRQDVVELLLKYKATVDMATNDDFADTALVAAVSEGHVMIVDTLVKAGANVNYINKKGKRILWTASYEGHTGIALILLQHEANIDLPNDDEFGETPLFVACYKGHLDTAAVLIKHGAVVNGLNKRGNTPLYRASQGGHIEVVELLLSSGADINKGQDSPLYVASLRGNFDLVKLLVHHRAEIDKPTDDDEYGSTPLIVACERSHISVAQLLIDNGADINYQNKRGWTPLLDASDEGHSAVVKLLIQSGAQLEIKNKESRTALMVASWRGHLKTVMELLMAGANINLYDENGLTALMLATQNGHVQVVQALLDAKADPNITESTAGWSALFFAAKSGYLQIIKLLVGKGADIGIRDKTGLTAIEVSEDQEIIDELQRHKSETTTEIQDQDDISISVQEPAREITQESAEVPEDKEEIRDQETLSKSQLTKEQTEQLDETYGELLKIFDILEESLRKEKKQRKGLSSNIVEANQQMHMLLDNN